MLKTIGLIEIEWPEGMTEELLHDVELSLETVLRGVGDTIKKGFPLCAVGRVSVHNNTGDMGNHGR